MLAAPGSRCDSCWCGDGEVGTPVVLGVVDRGDGGIDVDVDQLGEDGGW